MTDQSRTPHYPAAFINTIAEEGTKAEAVEWLQKIWNERCTLELEAADLRERLAKEREEAIEECAKVCEPYTKGGILKGDTWTMNIWAGRRDAIRALSQKGADHA